MRSSWSRASSAGLVGVVALSAAVLVGLSARESLGYDSFWHVFIARQERWRDLWHEIALNAHPPIYYLTLRAAISLLGRSFIVYRAVSILSVLASVVLVARVVARLTSSRALALVASAAFGLSLSAIHVGLEVRAYALLVAFLLLSFLAYVEWIGTNPARLSPWTRVLFAAALTGALLTHYSAFFFLCAALLTPLVLACVDERWRLRVAWEARRHLLASAAMFAVPTIAAAASYLHVRRWSTGLNHVAGFMYVPGQESRWAFTARTTRDVALLLLPSVGSEAAALAAGAVLVVASAWLATRRGFRARPGAVPIVVLGVMLVLNLVAALRARYPFGGQLRHEVFLFPFALIALFVLLEHVRRSLPGPLASRRAWTAVAALAVAGSSAFGLATGPGGPPALLEAELRSFRAALGNAPTILVDQFNFIPLFGRYHEWDWHLEWEARGAGVWQLWEVSRPGGRFEVCRSEQWQLDLSQPGTYADAAACLSRVRAPSVSVFRPNQGGIAPAWKIGDTAALAHDLSPRAGLVVDVLSVQGNDVYASFKAAEHLDPRNWIAIGEATYGGRCGAASGNATALLRAACDGRAACAYRVDDARTIGDPAPGCAKDFQASWTCGGQGGSRRVVVDAEAGLGGVALLTCVR